MIIYIVIPSLIRIREMPDAVELELHLWNAGNEKRKLEFYMEALEARLKELKDE